MNKNHSWGIYSNSECENYLLLKCKISEIWLVETACMFQIILIATVQISMEYETQESEAGHTKHLNSY